MHQQKKNEIIFNKFIQLVILINNVSCNINNNNNLSNNTSIKTNGK